MPAPLTPGYRPSVLWQEQVAEVDDGPPALPSQVDVLVVGTGYAGLSCAREVAAAGQSVVAVDAHPIGWGASTRNGGIVIPELKAGPAALDRSLGPLGRRLYQEVNDAFDHDESLAAGPSPTIACDYERTGQLYLARAARLVPSLEAMVREHGEELGEPVHFVPREALGEEVGTAAYHAGVVFERTGGLHPARFHAGLLSLARAAGAELVGSTRAARGTVEARDLALCTNAYADALVPALARRVAAGGQLHHRHRGAAARAGPGGLPAPHAGRLQELHPGDDVRRRPAVPRLPSTTGASPPTAGCCSAGDGRGRPRRSSRPATSSTTRWWPSIPSWRACGSTGRGAATWPSPSTASPTPAGSPAGPPPGPCTSPGCNSSGVALNTWLGAQLGRHLSSNAPPPSFADLPHRPVPLHRARRLYLPLVGLWFHHQDRGFHP